MGSECAHGIAEEVQLLLDPSHARDMGREFVIYVLNGSIQNSELLAGVGEPRDLSDGTNNTFRTGMSFGADMSLGADMSFGADMSRDTNFARQPRRSSRTSKSTCSTIPLCRFFADFCRQESTSVNIVSRNPA